MFTWFAARPPAQAKAAVITSVLPWPDDEKEQRRLQELVRACHDESRRCLGRQVVTELGLALPGRSVAGRSVFADAP